LRLESIGTEITDIERLIELSEEQVLTNKEQNVEELDKRINEEKEKIELQVEKINSEVLMTSITPNKESLEELARIKKKFDESTKRLNQYKTYQESLDLNAAPIKEIDDFNKKFEVRFKLWKNREQFDESQNKWLQ
jgi:hypothetical protein